MTLQIFGTLTYVNMIVKANTYEMVSLPQYPYGQKCLLKCMVPREKVCKAEGRKSQDKVGFRLRIPVGTESSEGDF